MPNRHTWRDAVRIDNHIRYNTLNSEWKVLLPIGHSTSSFLSMSWGKFVADLRYPDTSHSNFDEFVPTSILRNNYQINYTSFCSSWPKRSVFEFLFYLHTIVKRTIWRSQYFAYQHFLVLDCLTWRNDSIRVQLIHSFLENLRISAVWLTYKSLGCVALSGVFLSFVGSEKCWPVKPSFNCRLIQDDAVLLIVACKAGHSYNWIGADRHLENWDVFCVFGRNKWSLRIIEKVIQSLHPNLGI